MQAPGTVRTFGWGSVQVVIVAAVAVAGIAIGRWGIPAEDAATIVTSSRSDIVSSTDRIDNLVERKLAQMDARDAGYSVTVDQADAEVAGVANVAPIPASAVERKLAQTVTTSEVLSDAAHVSPIPASAVERKLEQTGTTSESLSDVPNVAPIPESAVERKLEQTGVRGFTALAESRYDEMFETKSAQMDARDAR